MSDWIGGPYKPAGELKDTHVLLAADGDEPAKDLEQVTGVDIAAAPKSSPVRITDPSGNWEIVIDTAVFEVLSSLTGFSPVRVGANAANNLLRVGLGGLLVEIRGDLTVRGKFTLDTQISEPAKPGDGEAVFWCSNGVGTASLGAEEGDMVFMSTDQLSVTTARVVHKHSTGVVIP